ncbi:MAG: response regulator transcription factor [Deltaproteobacteria bacterium]|nr:response regulator transcription factor [Deltaproteobacteria bacterium]
MPRVLIIEDEPDLARVLEYNLDQAGFTVQVVGRAGEGTRRALADPPDLVLLDLMLPDSPGTEVCRTLKSHPATRHVPVVMVTAKGDEIDRVVGFELGADDYVVKPFSVRELVLRVKAVLRRGDGEAPAAPGDRVTFGRLQLDRTAHRVYVDGDEVTLTALEFRLLNTLCERRNRVQSRDTLLADVWGLTLHVETRTVDTHIKRLREKLGPAGDYIYTVRGVGYRFAASPGDER